MLLKFTDRSRRKSYSHAIFSVNCRFADMHNFKDLAKAALVFIQVNFPSCCKGDEFLELPKKYAIELLSSEYLRVDSEVQVPNNHSTRPFNID